MTKFYKWLGIICSFGLTALYAYTQRREKQHLQDELQEAEAESEALSRNNEALAESEKIEQETIERVKNSPVDRDHFSKRRVL